jgi:hypothetical protein
VRIGHVSAGLTPATDWMRWITSLPSSSRLVGVGASDDVVGASYRLGRQHALDPGGHVAH